MSGTVNSGAFGGIPFGGVASGTEIPGGPLSGGFGQTPIATYQALITEEHRSAVDFVATVVASVQPFVDIQNTLLGLSEDYDLDVAVGSQLDTVGIWVGVTRFVSVPLSNVYFSWDVPVLGWDLGVWQGPFDPSSGLVSLDDTTYRFVLRAKIAANDWDGTVPGAAAALANIFSDADTPGTLLFIEDNQNMSMTYGISGVIPPPIYQALLAGGSIPLVPGGIEVNYVVTSVSGTPCFGFDTDSAYVSGWDVGSWPEDLDTFAFGGTFLTDNGGVVVVDPTVGYQTDNAGLPAGTVWSNGGVVNVVPGITPSPTAPPLFFGTTTAQQLQLTGGGNLPTTAPTAGTLQLWNNGDEVCIA